MREPGRDLDLAEEPLGPDRQGQLGLEDFQRDLAVVLDVVSEVEGATKGFEMIAHARALGMDLLH